MRERPVDSTRQSSEEARRLAERILADDYDSSYLAGESAGRLARAYLSLAAALSDEVARREQAEAALFQVYVECGEDTDGAESLSDMGRVDPPIEILAVRAVKELRAECEACPLPEELASAERQVRELREVCPICGHLWLQHDPEDGQCDAHSTRRIGVCECGRNVAWMQEKIAALSLQNLLARSDEAGE